MPRPRVILLQSLLVLVPLLAGCGYRLAGGNLASGSGRSIAVPLFQNATTNYRIEQRLTEAVRRELIQRTQYDVLPASAGDFVLSGQVLSVTSIPIIFTDRGRSTAYTVAVEVNVSLTDSRDGSLVFADERWTFREVFELSNDSETFVPEDAAAMDRLARRFASSLVASLFHRSP